MGERRKGSSETTVLVRVYTGSTVEKETGRQSLNWTVVLVFFRCVYNPRKKGFMVQTWIYTLLIQ